MKICYLTLATSYKYLCGANILYKSYLNSRSKYPFFVLVYHDTDISDFTFPTKIIKKLEPKNYDHPEWKMAVYPENYSKFYAFLMEEYDFVVYMDCDCLFTKNIDSIVESYYSINKPIVYIRNEILYSADGTKKCYPCEYFCAKPSAKIFIDLIKQINDEPMECVIMYDYFVSQNLAGFAPDNEFINAILHIGGIPGKKYWDITVKDLCNYYIKNPAELLKAIADFYGSDKDKYKGEY